MSKAGKLVKDLVKAKKESVMGKLANGDDPMEPWSKRFDAPIKEEALNEDTWLFRYIRSLGWDPTRMTFAQHSKYSRSNAFKHWKQSHMERRPGETATMEEVVAEGKEDKIKQLKQDHATAIHWSKNERSPQKREAARQKAEKIKAHLEKQYKQIVDEEVEQIDEAGTGLLMSYIKSKGLDPRMMDGNQKSAYSKSSEFRLFKNRHVKEVSGMGERGDDWNEEKKAVKEAVDAKDTVTMDIPLLIRVLEYAREDAKTDMDLHKVVENLINMRGKGSLSMDMYDKIVAIKEELEKLDELSVNKMMKYSDAAEKDRKRLNAKWDAGTASRKEQEKAIGREEGENRATNKIKKKTGKYPWQLNKEEVEQVDELSKGTLTSYATKARADAANLSKQGDAASKRPSTKSMQTALDKFRKAAKRNIAAAGAESKARVKEEVEQIDELKKQNDNMEIDDRITREDLRQWFSKSHPEGDWKRINSKGEVAGPCAREPGEPKPKCMSKEKRSQLSKSERAAAVASKRKHDPVADRAGKGGKPVNVSNYGKGKLSEEEVDEACWDTHKQVGTKMKGGKVVPNCVPKNEEVEHIDEKNKPTNPGLWSRAKSMARSKFDVYPSAYANGWASKWYKSKGGGWKSVKEDTVNENKYEIEEGLGRMIAKVINKVTSAKKAPLPQQKDRREFEVPGKTNVPVQEGIYGIQDSPLSATNSVKAMESTGRKKEMTKSARMIKSIYKKKNVKETMYDWEKSEKGGKVVDEPTAKVIMKGGTTMTGKPRDTIEIEPVLRTKLNRPAGTNPSA